MRRSPLLFAGLGLGLGLGSACSPLVLENNRFGAAVFLAAGAVGTVADTGLTIVAQEDGFGCDSAPIASPGRKTLALQASPETLEVGAFLVEDDEASAFVELDACALGGGVVRAESGVIAIDSLSETNASGRFELVVDGEPANGTFDIAICPDGLPIPERDCPDSGNPPPLSD